MLYKNILETIGNTPIIQLQRLSKDALANVFVKLEFFNPLSSVKDRIGLNMIEAAERAGRLKPGMKIMEATSGNTGIALAFICASKGYPLTLVMPETMSLERRTLLLLFGAQLILTPGPLGMKGAVAKVKELQQLEKNIFVPQQFDNPANPEIHKGTTAEEIWKDMQGDLDVLVLGVGTGGTITGCAEVLKQRLPKLKVIAVEPEESPVLSGGGPGPHKIQGIGAGFVPSILNTKLIDGIEKVSSSEALQWARRLIKEEGIPAGISSGAAMSATFRWAQKSEYKGKRIVTLLPSSSERYLSTLLAEAERVQAASLTVTPVDEKYL